MVLARVERGGDAAYGAALARGIGALEHQHERAPAEGLVAREQREPPLVAFEQRLVLLLVQRLPQHEAVEQRARVRRGRQRRRGLARHEVARAGIQALAQGVEERARDEEFAVARIGAVDDQPRRLARAGMAQRVLGHLAVAVVVLARMPVLLGDAPARARILLQRLEALALPVLREVEPQLDQQHPFAHQHRLETVDLVQALIEVGLLRHLVYALAHRVGVPVAEQDADAPARRQRAPEAPHEGTLGLLGGGRVEGQRLDVARVHPLVQEIDRLALAGPVDAVDQHHHGKGFRFEQIELRVEQLRTQLRLGGVVLVLVDLVAQFCRFEHRPAS